MGIILISVIGLLLSIQLQGINAKDVSILTMGGHISWVNSVAVTPDGTKVVSGSDDQTIKMWNLADGALIKTLTGHGHSVYQVAITPDGSKIVSSSADNTVKIWNLSDGSLIKTLTGHTSGVSSVAISPDGTKIVSGSTNAVIKIWNLTDGALIRTLTGHTSGVWGVAVTPDGSKIVSGSGDNSVKIWNLSDGSLIRTLDGHTNSIRSVAITPDGSKIVSGSQDNSIKVWNLSDGTLIRTLEGHTNYVNGVAITADSSKIVSGSEDYLIKIWNISDGSLIFTLEGHSDYVNGVAVTPDGSKFVSGGDITIKVWDPWYVPPTINQADWYDMKKSEGFGFKVAILNNIAAISVPFCINPWQPDTCDGGNILTYKMDDSAGWWVKHKKLINPYRNRDNRFGFNMVMNSDYLIISAPGSNYISTDVGIIVFYKWSQAQDTYVKESIIRYRKVTKNFELGTSISNINKITAIGMPTCDNSEDIRDSGCAHVYRKKDDGLWGGRHTITLVNAKSNERFGQCVTLGSDTTLAVSNSPDDASDQAVYIYSFDDTEWKLLQTLLNNNKPGFGWRVAFNGGVLYVSILFDGTDKDGAGSIVTYTLGADDQYVASSVIKPKTSVEGKHFGFSFSFSSDSSKLVVGARPCFDYQACYIKGSVYIFTKNAGDWVEYFHVDSPMEDGSDGFGHDVAVDGDMILVSAPYDYSDFIGGKSYFVKK